MTTPAATASAFQRWRTATLAPFSQRAFALFWWAALVSSFGSLIQTVGASWMMATIAPSADRVALVQTASTLPFFCLSLVAGALADTYDRRKLMLVSQWLMLLASVALAAVGFLGLVTPGLLLLFTFLIGCGTALMAPAWQAAIGELVPRAQLASAVTANALAFNVARSVGPAIGGIIVAVAGAAVAFAINAVSYVGMIATLLWWRPAQVRNPLPREPLGAAIAAGVRYVRLSPNLLRILARCLLFSLPLAAVPALMPVVARDLLAGGPRTYGLLLGAFGVGAMLGALSSAALRVRVSADRLLQGVSLLATISLLIIATSPWLAVTLVAHLLTGVVWVLGLTTFNIGIQLSSPRWVTGRTLATYQTVTFAGMALGSWLWGELAAVSTLRTALAAAGLSSLVALLASPWLRVEISKLGALDPQATSTVTPPKVELDDASGPIVVTIEYRVPMSQAAEFVRVANELGRIRRRDGARRWSVCQDLDAPEIWMERFDSPTWADYLRRQTRPTRADQEVREQLSQLVVGGRGTVRRLIDRPAGAEPLGGHRERAEPLDDTSTHS